MILVKLFHLSCNTSNTSTNSNRKDLSELGQHQLWTLDEALPDIGELGDACAVHHSVVCRPGHVHDRRGQHFRFSTAIAQNTIENGWKETIKQQHSLVDLLQRRGVAALVHVAGHNLQATQCADRHLRNHQHGRCVCSSNAACKNETVNGESQPIQEGRTDVGKSECAS